MNFSGIALGLIAVGALLLLGPTLVQWLLGFCSILVPNTTGTTIFLIISLLANIVLAVCCRGAKREDRISKVLLIVADVSIIGVFLIVTNSLWRMAYRDWYWLLKNASATFTLLRWIGGIAVMVGSGYVVCRHSDKGFSKKPNTQKKRTMNVWQSNSRKRELVRQTRPVFQPQPMLQPQVPQWQVQAYPKQAMWEQSLQGVSGPRVVVGYQFGRPNQIPQIMPQPYARPVSVSTEPRRRYRSQTYNNIIQFPSTERRMVSGEELDIHLPVEIGIAKLL